MWHLSGIGSIPTKYYSGVIGKSVIFCFLSGSYNRYSRIAITPVQRRGVKNVSLCNNPLKGTRAGDTSAENITQNNGIPNTPIISEKGR